MPVPTGKLSGKHRPFPRIAADLRHAVFSVIRHRRVSNSDQVQAFPLGSGFFVSRDVFLTCNHVINGPAAPHQEGDFYQLVSNNGAEGVLHTLATAHIGETIHLFPESDLALLILNWPKEQCHVPLDYADAPEGTDIGVVGYPLAALGTVGGALRYDGLIYRVARGVITGVYQTNIRTEQQQIIENVPVVEVNFLFVPGNSGGPIFNAETGRVLAFVHGYRPETINQRLARATNIPNLPAGLGPDYIEALHAIYSIGIKVRKVREILERFGVTL